MTPTGNITNLPPISGAVKSLITATFLGLSGWALYEMRIKSAVLDPRLKAVADGLRYPESSDVLVHPTYTGIGPVDYGFRFLVTAFLPGASGFHDPAALVLSAYFLMSFFTLLTISVVEAGRAGAKGSVIYFTSIWAILFQTVGGAVIIPLLHLFLLRQWWKPEYYSKSNRPPIGYAKALVPSLILGYLLPTIAMYWPSLDPDLVLKQKLVAFWQVSPFVVNILLSVFSKLYADSGESREKDEQIAQFYVKLIYLICFLVSALTHATMLYFWKSWGLSFKRIFVPQQYMLDQGVADPLHYIFQIDYVGIFASGLVMAVLAVWFLHRIKPLENVGPTTAFSLLLSSFVWGPAASIAIAFSVRERVLWKLQNDRKVE